MRYASYIPDMVTYTVVLKHAKTSITTKIVGFESVAEARSHIKEKKKLGYRGYRWRVRRATRSDYKVVPRLPNARQELRGAVENVISKTKIEKL